MAIERPPVLPRPLNRSLSHLRFAARRATAGLRALPQGLILGAAKAGTTSLFRYLEQHPDVRTGTRKEVHYFDFHHHHGPSWYQAHFPPRASMQPGQRLLEGTPFYLVHPGAPARVSEMLPDARLLVLLRDPVDRAWSHYHAWHRRDRDPRSFHEAVTTEIDALRQGDSWAAMVTRRMAGEDVTDEAARRPPAYVERSMYGQQVGRWLRHFTLESFWFSTSEDLFAEPAKTVASAETALGLTPWNGHDFPVHNPGKYDQGPDPDAVDALRTYLAPDVAQARRATGLALAWPGFD